MRFPIGPMHSLACETENKINIMYGRVTYNSYLLAAAHQAVDLEREWDVGQQRAAPLVDFVPPLSGVGELLKQKQKRSLYDIPQQ